MIAKHVMNIHMNRPNANGDENGNAVGEIPLDKMKAYIAYCKRYKQRFFNPIMTNIVSQQMRSSLVSRGTGNVEQPLC